MRKPDLAAAIADKADLSKDQANRVLNAVLDEITKALSEKDSVTLHWEKAQTHRPPPCARRHPRPP